MNHDKESSQQKAQKRKRRGDPELIGYMWSQ